jgi:hypothetical protein
VGVVGCAQGRGNEGGVERGMNAAVRAQTNTGVFQLMFTWLVNQAS